MRGTILATVFAASLGACYTEGTVGYGATYRGYGPTVGVYAETPDLITVSPGVQVVADYDEPVFYSDGFYWRYYDGLWYRSSNYATGWYYWSSPPVAVLRIDRPYAYRHYRPSGYVVRSRPRYRPSEVIVRDHRAPPPAYRAEPVIRARREVREAPPAREPSPVVRDRRDAPAPAARAPSPAPAAVRDHRAPPPAKDGRVRDHRD